MKTKQSLFRSHVITRMFVLLVALFVMQGAKSQTTYNLGQMVYKLYSDGHAEVAGFRSGYASTTSIVIPASLTVDSKKYLVTKIAENAFKNNTSLQTVTYAYGDTNYNLTTIGDFAFQGCINLTVFGPNTSAEGIRFPKTVEEIGRGAFSNCSSIKSVTFPATSKCTSIGQNAFYDCGATSINVPALVNSIDYGAFSTGGECTVTFNNADWVAQEGKSHLIGDNQNRIFDGKQKVTFGPNVTTIGSKRFWNEIMKEIIIPNTVLNVVQNAFYKCYFEKLTLNIGNDHIMNIFNTSSFTECSGSLLVINADEISSYKHGLFYNIQFSTWTVNAKKIGGLLIEDNEYIQTLEIPNLEQFEGQIFANCPNLSTIKANESRFKVMAPAKYPESKAFYSADGTVLYTALPQVRNIRLLPQCAMIHGEAFNPEYHTVMDARDLEHTPTLTGGSSSKVPAFVLVPADKASRYATFASAGAEIVETSTGKQFDANGDGVISIGDVAWVVNKVLGKATINDADFVDLGLPSGTLWAKMNLGASSESALGNNYQWGDTKPCNNTASLNNYCWYDAVALKYTKYNDTDHLLIMDDKDDAAVVAGKGRIPSKEQFAELFDKCTISTERINYVDCYRLKGPNGNELVLPSIFYSTNTLFNMNTPIVVMGGNVERFVGRESKYPIRPVK